MKLLLLMNLYANNNNAYGCRALDFANTKYNAN